MLVAFIPFFFWAIGDLLGTFLTRRIGGYAANFWSIIIAVIGLTILLPFHVKEFQNYTPFLIAANILLGTIFLFSNQYYARALEHSNASLTNVIAGSFPVVTVLISLSLLGEHITLIQTVGIIFSILGVVIATLNIREVKRGITLNDKKLKLAFVAMIGWGIFYALIKLITVRVGWFFPAYISFLCFPFVYASLKKRRVDIGTPLTWKLPVILLFLGASVLVRSGEVVFNIALQHNLSSLVTPLAGSYPVLFVLLASIFLKDKMQRTQWLGVGFGLVGIVILATA